MDSSTSQYEKIPIKQGITGRVLQRRWLELLPFQDKCHIYIDNCNYSIRTMEKGIISGNPDVDIQLTEEQMRKMEQRLRERSRNDRKRPSDRRASLRVKSGGRQPASLTREEADMIQSWTAMLENVEQHMELIDELCQKKRISFLMELKGKISAEEYRLFLSGLQLQKLTEGGRLQEQGRFHSWHYIVIEGSVSACRERKGKEEERQLLEVFEYEVGEVLISNTLQTHKCNPYTNRAKRLALVLRFGEESFNRYIKRVWQRETDDLAGVLGRSLLFRGMGGLQIKKYLPYCSFSRFKYGDLVYEQGDVARRMFVVLDGEVEMGQEKQEDSGVKSSLVLSSPNLYRVSHDYKQRKEIKIVRLGKGELFGLQSASEEKHYRHYVRVTSNVLKVLVMGRELLSEIAAQNPVLVQNKEADLERVMGLHVKLLERHNLTTLVPLKKKPKRNKKKNKKRKPEVSLEWWGLAGKLEGSKKYRMPTPPKNQAQSVSRKEPLILQQRTSKLDYFKRRLFEEEMEGLTEEEEKQNAVYPPGLVPRLQKVKIQMINPRPKVVNNAERIKRKLVDYAKNGQVFCDKLQLQ